MHPNTTTGFLAQAKAGALAYLRALHDASGGEGRWKHNAGMARPCALVATRFALETLHGLGELDNLPKGIRDGAIRYLRECQDRDGFFKDPLVGEGVLVRGHGFHWPDLWGQMDCRAVLRKLGAEPRYPAPEPVQGEGDNGGAWLTGGDWRNPWLMGDRFSRAVKATVVRPKAGQASAPEWLAAVEPWFAFVEERVLDPETGLPDAAGCAEPDVAMAGLFKLLFAYLHVGRRYPHIEAAIDSTLALQETEGDFARRDELSPPSGRTFVLRYARDMCINWDAVWTLRTLDRMGGAAHRHKDIVEAGCALAECLLHDYRKPDGGFAFAADHCLMVHMGVWLSDALPESDVAGTFMALECLRYADEWLAGR